MQDLNWNCLDFKSLTNAQLYEILKLRAEVFVVEQECIYQDMDNYDQQALHVLGSMDDVICGYARLLAPGVKYQEPSIGRVITSMKQRTQGIGKEVVRQSLAYCNHYWPEHGVRISAQQRLEKFYLQLGFNTESDAYLEDGIPHIEMLWQWR